MTTKGLILAGGKSKRFGTDKALASHHGATLLERTIGLLREVGLEPVIVTREGADYAFTETAILRDELPEKGPLGGIYTAMSFFERLSFMVLTCDMPFLSARILDVLISRHEDGNGVTVFRTADGRIQPFPGIYEPSIFPVVQERLLKGELSMHGLLESVTRRETILWEGEQTCFRNVNSREDLEVSQFLGLSH